MRIRMLAVPVALVAALALAACGSDSKSDAPSKAEYIASADTICKTGGQAVDALAAKLTEDSTEAEYTAFKTAAVPSLRGQIKSLRALTPPDGDADKLKAIYDQVEAATSQLESTAPADIPAFFQSNPFAEPNKAATAYGMKECGKD